LKQELLKIPRLDAIQHRLDQAIGRQGRGLGVIGQCPSLHLELQLPKTTLGDYVMLVMLGLWISDELYLGFIKTHPSQGDGRSDISVLWVLLGSLARGAFKKHGGLLETV